MKTENPNTEIQHGLDDNPHNDAEKGAAIGGLGGAALGAAAGSVAGPVGTVVGAVAGGLMGAGASGVAVGIVDQHDNDNTVSGVGDASAAQVARDEHIRQSHDVTTTDSEATGVNAWTGEESDSGAGEAGLATGAIAGGIIGTAVGGPVGAVVGGTIGSLAGGVTGDAVEAADHEDDSNAHDGTDIPRRAR